MTKPASITISLAQLASTLEAELSCDFAPLSAIEPSQPVITLPAQETTPELTKELTKDSRETPEATLDFSVPSQEVLHRQQELLSWLTNLGNRLPPYQGNRP